MSLTLLIVDDEKVHRATLFRVLARTDRFIDQAGHGAEALDYLALRPYSLVLTDYHMPIMDGRELVHRMQDGYACTPVLLMTAEEPDVQLALQHELGHYKNFLGILSKPYLLEELNAVIDSITVQE